MLINASLMPGGGRTGGGGGGGEGKGSAGIE